MRFRKTRCLLPLLAFLTAAGPSIAGEFVVSASGRSWRSTECVQPAAPTLAFSDTETLNAAVNRLNAYTAQVESYNACLRREAERDMDLIVQDLARAQQAAMHDATLARQQITQQKQ